MPGKLIKTYVEHGYYGCESGCCGHTVVAEDARGEMTSAWEFSHPYEDDPEKRLDWAKELCAIHYPDVPFSAEDCKISDE